MIQFQQQGQHSSYQEEKFPEWRNSEIVKQTYNLYTRSKKLFWVDIEKKSCSHLLYHSSKSSGLAVLKSIKNTLKDGYTFLKKFWGIEHS